MEKVLALAKVLGLIETIHTDKKHKSSISNDTIQQYDYLIIIDFESTCWDSKHRRQNWQFLPEIIEFPAVLINLSTGIIESEFHHFVMPMENPKLSEFCTKLTGIKQEEVESGVPLATCLMLFNQWIFQMCSQKSISFHSKIPHHKSCTFVTWSDWDLAVCLQNEVKRKQLRRPDILSHWIDLRAVYKRFYNRKPQELRGALAELGITFSGREHSGIADARNTALLAFRMTTDGCQLEITGSIQIAQRRDELPIRKHQKLEESMPNIQKYTLRGQPLATITVRALSKTPVKSKCLKRVCEKSKSSTRTMEDVSHATDDQKRKEIETPNSKTACLSTPNRRIKTPGFCKRTPPLCRCGRRANLKVANSPGPNQGRSFFSCSNSKRSLGISVKKAGCGFFMWC